MAFGIQEVDYVEFVDENGLLYRRELTEEGVNQYVVGRG